MVRRRARQPNPTTSVGLHLLEHLRTPPPCGSPRRATPRQRERRGRITVPAARYGRLLCSTSWPGQSISPEITRSRFSQTPHVLTSQATCTRARTLRRLGSRLIHARKREHL